MHTYTTKLINNRIAQLQVLLKSPTKWPPSQLTQWQEELHQAQQALDSMHIVVEVLIARCQDIHDNFHVPADSPQEDEENTNWREEYNTLQDVLA